MGCFVSRLSAALSVLAALYGLSACASSKKKGTGPGSGAGGEAGAEGSGGDSSSSGTLTTRGTMKDDGGGSGDDTSSATSRASGGSSAGGGSGGTPATGGGGSGGTPATGGAAGAQTSSADGDGGSSSDSGGTGTGAASGTGGAAATGGANGTGGSGTGGSGNSEVTKASEFSPGGSLCSVGFSPIRNEVWVYPCSGADLIAYSLEGDEVGSVPRPGEVANDVDIDVAPIGFKLGNTNIKAGTLLFLNGESGTLDIHAVDPETGAVFDVLVTDFGASHVVGGGFHATRGTFFALQDRVPGETNGNLIAEIDVVTGQASANFSILPDFDVNYGDADVCQSSGNLFVVSSIESTLAEFTPTGSFVGEYPLPEDVTSLTGIDIDPNSGQAWVSALSGTVFQLEGLPCSD